MKHDTNMDADRMISKPGQPESLLKSLNLKPSKNISSNFPTAFRTEEYIILKKKIVLILDINIWYIFSFFYLFSRNSGIGKIYGLFPPTSAPIPATTLISNGK